MYAPSASPVYPELEKVHNDSTIHNPNDAMDASTNVPIQIQPQPQFQTLNQFSNSSIPSREIAVISRKQSIIK